MIKILHIIDSLGLGGAQIIIKGIFEYQQSNNNIFLVTLREKKITIKIDHKNINIYHSCKKYSLAPLFFLKDFIKKEKIEVLHCHLVRSQIFGYILKKIYFPNIKLIFHEHGRIFTNNLIYNVFLKLAKSKVDLFLAVSRVTRDQLSKKINIENNKIKVLYNFINLDKFNKKNISCDIEKERKNLGIEENDLIIGYVGRLAKIKGVRYLIKALAYLKFPYKVLIIGDGSEKAYLEYLSRKNKVDNNVLFLGYRNDIVSIYSLLDVLVVPSLSESFGLSVVEAQASGVPVIASNILALNEIIKDRENGLLFEVKDKKDLAEKIKLFYFNKETRSGIINNGLENVKKYGLDRYIKKLNNCYE